MTNGWIAAVLMVGMSLSVWGQSQSAPPDHFAITTRQVAQTLSGRGIQITERQVSLLANVVASDPNPILDILAVEPAGTRRFGTQSQTETLVKLGCHLPGTCLAFYAIVSGSAETSLVTTSAPSASRALSPVKVSWLKPPTVVAMRSGAHATLVMDDNRSHIQVAVVSLENGKIGDRIHVASPDHKQVYVGEVVGSNLLRRTY